MVGIGYPGLKLTENGAYLLEENARPGYPETEAWVPKLESDFLDISVACATGKLAELPNIEWRSAATACIVLATRDYPTVRDHQEVVEGLEDVQVLPDISVYSGAAKIVDGHIIATGGRAFSVVAKGREGESLKSVLTRGYEAVSGVRFDGHRPVMRHDIGRTALSPLFKERVAIMRAQLPTIS
jgi:phosphoribosylamine-glycine ligase